MAKESGQTVESMQRFRSATKKRPNLPSKRWPPMFGFLVGLLVMALIVVMIFRLAGFYFGTINSLLDNKKLGYQLSARKLAVSRMAHSR